VSEATTVDPDLLRRAWGPLTVRVAWELVRAGVRVRPATLRIVRTHACWRMAGARDVAEVEARAARAVEEYLARADGRWAAVDEDADLSIPLPRAWRADIMDDAAPEHELVFHLYYADGLPLQEIEQRARVDIIELRSAREALRALMRHILQEHGRDASAWEPGRIDRFLTRLSNVADEPCPAPSSLTNGPGRVHAEGCPRCARALRLFREGVLAPQDLEPPADGTLVPSDTVDLVSIQVHPNGRDHTRALAKILGNGARVSASNDEIVVHAPECPHLQALLDDAARHSAPTASHLRVHRARVQGAWGRAAPIGPGLAELRAATSRLAWGETRGLEALPTPLPALPSAARWWFAAAMLGVVSAATVAAVVLSPGPDGDVPLETEGLATGVRFDTDDLASVWVLAAERTGVRVAFAGPRVTDKVELADGHGRYVLPGRPEAWVVVAAPADLPDLEATVHAGDRDESVRELARRLRRAWPQATVRVATPEDAPAPPSAANDQAAKAAAPSEAAPSEPAPVAPAPDATTDPTPAAAP
jgi:hypothetical protein